MCITCARKMTENQATGDVFVTRRKKGSPANLQIDNNRTTTATDLTSTVSKKDISSKIDIQPFLADIVDDVLSTFGESSDKNLLESFRQSLHGRLSELVDKTVDICVNSVAEHFSRELDTDRQNQRSLNLCIRGLEENITTQLNPHEREIELEAAVVDVLNTVIKPLVPIDTSKIVRVRRIGKFDVPNGSSKPKPRPVIVTFMKHSTKMDIFRNKRNCKGTSIMVTEDLTPRRRGILRAAIDRLTSKNVWTANGVIKFTYKGKTYSVTSMEAFEKLVESLQIPEPVRKSRPFHTTPAK